MRIIACMRCGSKRVSAKRLIAGPVVFEHEHPDTVKCLDCGLESVPLTFRNEQDREKFRRSINERPD